MKTQDTMAICVNQPAQHAALAAVNEVANGGTFVKDNIAALQSAFGRRGIIVVPRHTGLRRANSTHCCLLQQYR
jgi:aspartate/methionine/tyrosine aminotransferase